MGNDAKFGKKLTDGFKNLYKEFALPCSAVLYPVISNAALSYTTQVLQCMSYVGVTLANLFHIFFDSYSANTKNINVTMLKINVII